MHCTIVSKVTAAETTLVILSALWQQNIRVNREFKFKLYRKNNINYTTDITKYIGTKLYTVRQPKKQAQVQLLWVDIFPTTAEDVLYCTRGNKNPIKF